MAAGGAATCCHAGLGSLFRKSALSKLCPRPAAFSISILVHSQSGSGSPRPSHGCRHAGDRGRGLRRLVCAAAVLPRDRKASLLAGVDREHADIVARVLELATAAAEQWTVAHTDFLTPPARADALMSLRRLADVGAVVSGGYAEAERCRLSVGHPEAIEAAAPGASGVPGAVAAVSVAGNFTHDAAAHGDFLGAILASGVAREKLGDILVQEQSGAHVLVAPDLVPFLTTAVTQVRSSPVTVEEIPLADLRTRAPKIDQITTVEASLRVDAVASAGFKLSRTKLADLISAGCVRVNWKDVVKAGTVLKSGDVVSVRGKGRLEIGEISTTKKGKYAVQVTRFL